MAAITPTGSRSVIAQRPLPAGEASMGTTSPHSRCASSEENSKVSAARSTSARASRIGLPASELRASDNSSRRARTMSDDLRKMAARSSRVNSRMTRAAEYAASTAASTWSLPAS